MAIKAHQRPSYNVSPVQAFTAIVSFASKV
jgi:hypothetical protein